MNLEIYKQLKHETESGQAQLIAVSKTKPAEDILQLYNNGQRLFGENKVQEMVDKYEVLPKDIKWHMIGHLQSNKVKYIAPFVSMIHSVDSLKLLQEINKQAVKNNRIIDCLLQIYIASEETKFGLSEEEAKTILACDDYKTMTHVRICGLMGIASNTNNYSIVASEFQKLQSIFLKFKNDFFSSCEYFKELSMGMSSDYKIALQHKATLIRIGSSIFGHR